MNFTRSVSGQKIKLAASLTSALKGDMVCSYEVSLPDDIMEKLCGRNAPGINSFPWKRIAYGNHNEKYTPMDYDFCLSAEENMLLSLCFWDLGLG